MRRHPAAPVPSTPRHVLQRMNVGDFWASGLCTSGFDESVVDFLPLTALIYRPLALQSKHLQVLKSPKYKLVVAFHHPAVARRCVANEHESAGAIILGLWGPGSR